MSLYKTPLVEFRLKFMNPKLKDIMLEMAAWVQSKGLEPCVTETVTTLIEDTICKRVSSTHREGRAFDLRTRDWPRELLKEFETCFEIKYGSLGAVGLTTKVPSLLVWHDIGLGEHFHVQLNKSYEMKMPKNINPRYQQSQSAG